MKAKRVTIIVALAAIGCLLMLAGCALAGFDFETLFEDSEVYTQVEREAALDPNAEIDIESNLEDIRVEASQDGLVHLSYADSEHRTHLYACETGSLSLRVSEDNRPWNEYIQFNFSRKKQEIVLRLPANFAGRLRVHGTTGDLSVVGISGLERLDAEVTTGAIVLSESGANAVLAQTTTGHIRLEKVTADELALRYTTDGATLADVTADTLDVRGVTGGIALERVLARQIALRATTGDITGSIACDIAEFSIDSHTTTGASNLPNGQPGGERTLTAQTTTGNIELQFER